MSRWEREIRIDHLFRDAKPYLLDRSLLERWLDASGILARRTLQVAEFHPAEGHPGCAMVIVGAKFSETRAENEVLVGGQPAFVVEASATRLLVLTDPRCKSGPVEVNVGPRHAVGPYAFSARSWARLTADGDGPPIAFTGRGRPGMGGPTRHPLPGGAAAGSIPPTGIARVLVVLTYPTDSVPASQTTVRNAVLSTFGNVHDFYHQVSYGTLDVQVDVSTFVALLDNADHYHRANGAPGYPNIDLATIDQLTAEAAQGAVNQGFNLDDYAVMVVLVHLPGLGVRAWGGWTQQEFTYNDGAGTDIHLVAAAPISMIAARHDADWGRAAHEFGHGLVDGGLVLGEDVYGSDLVDASQATAQQFEMMGSHDNHPMFSGWYMQQLGYYSAANIHELQWDRNPFAQEFDVVAHGDSVDTVANRYNLVRIKIASGLDYYIEVRQRPPAGAAQIYDTNIPVAAGHSGGVVVTRAISGLVNNNQQMRLITLTHDAPALVTGGVATDPLRGLRISVVNDQVSTNPLVCRVRVEWAQQIADTPGGDLDLWLTPWGPGWESVDIWIDRQPFGAYDFTDAGGNPTGNGDEPRPLEINQFWARVHNTGLAASNVRLSYYVVTPPGVGDSGTWTPIQTKTLASVPSNGTADEFVNWVPAAGEHTCLKVVAEQQLGEVAGANNMAQENVFNFQPAAGSVPEPVAMPIAIRNPLDRPAVVRVDVLDVPEGYRVYLPTRSVRLPARGERKLALLVVPTFDYARLRETMLAVQRSLKVAKPDPAPRIRVLGRIEHGYVKEVAPQSVPAACFMPIGGITARVEPKRLSKITLEEDPRHGSRTQIAVRGSVSPALPDQKLRVDLAGPQRTTHSVIATTDAQGFFEARFSLEKLSEPARDEVTTGRPGPVARPRVENEDIVYRVQAHIFNAASLAPSDSNVVTATVRR
jgi:M6 family metalloprotease-like protein